MTANKNRPEELLKKYFRNGMRCVKSDKVSSYLVYLTLFNLKPKFVKNLTFFFGSFRYLDEMFGYALEVWTIYEFDMSGKYTLRHDKPYENLIVVLRIFT